MTRHRTGTEEPTVPSPQNRPRLSALSGGPNEPLQILAPDKPDLAPRLVHPAAPMEFGQRPADHFAHGVEFVTKVLVGAVEERQF